MIATVAFFSPAAAPTAGRISGARRLARLTVTALRQAGYDVRLASRFEPGAAATDHAHNDHTSTERIRAVAGKLAARVARRIGTLDEEARPRALVSLVVQNGAPDLLAPAIACLTDIPLVTLRAGHNDTVPDGIAFAPFVDAAQYAMELPGDMRAPLRAMVGSGIGLDPDTPWIATAAMMEGDDTVESFRLLAAALERIAGRPWQLVVAGDGARRQAVAEALFPLGPARIRLAGTMRGGDLAALYRAADVYAWPALGAPLAMACLEAQAAGMPVVACAQTGAAAFVRDGVTGHLVSANDADAFGASVQSLLDDPAACRSMGEAARQHIAAHHDVGVAAECLRGAIEAAIAGHPSS